MSKKTNSMTAHSVALRNKTSSEWQRENKDKFDQVLIRAAAQTGIIEEFKAILDEIGGTRPEAVKKLCELYRSK